MSLTDHLVRGHAGIRIRLVNYPDLRVAEVTREISTFDHFDFALRLKKGPLVRWDLGKLIEPLFIEFVLFVVI